MTLEDPELLEYVGRIVVEAALLEYTVAMLVATADGLRDDACEAEALQLVTKPGKAMRELDRLAKESPDRPEFRWLHGDTATVLRGRHFIAHAVAQEPAITDDGEAALFILAPKADEPETMVTLSQLVSQARLLEDSRQRIQERIDAETAGRPYRPHYYSRLPRSD